jgi:hypothetical protein
MLQALECVEGHILSIPQQAYISAPGCYDYFDIFYSQIHIATD